MGSIEPDVHEARIRRSQGAWHWVKEPTFLCFKLLKSGLTLNPYNKRHSFGLFISLYLCGVVDYIKSNAVYLLIFQYF